MRNLSTAVCGVVLSLLVIGMAFSLWAPSGQEQAGQAGDAPEVTFTPSGAKVEAYDFLEVTLAVRKPTAKNPFTDVSVTGQFRREDDPPMSIEGFCDSQDGTTYHIRFMPAKPGKYSYTVTFRQGDATRTHSGQFEATDGRRRGVLRVDRDHPWHFVWEGTGE